MAKPEVLDSVGLGRPERRVTFEAKESSVFQITKRSGTGGITAFGEHYCTPLLLWRIEAPPMRLVLHYRSATRFSQVNLISRGLAPRSHSYVAGYTSSRIASTPLTEEAVLHCTRAIHAGASVQVQAE
jgi:hypothetical protein